MPTILIEGHFKCPTCKRKTLVEHLENVVVERKMRELYYGYNDDKFLNSDATGIGYLCNILGEPNFLNLEEAAHSYRCKGCQFIVPVRNREELLEWLMFHNMAVMHPHHAESWPMLRCEWIEKGLISRKFLKALHGALYVPPTREEVCQAHILARCTKV